MDRMSERITLPTPDELADRIRACREELAALRKLLRMARAARNANAARERHQAGSAPHATREEERK
jgi:hypothetical protein